MLHRILLQDFRNHAATALDGTARFNLLVGENGAGKTNVLEALSLLAPGRGLRRAALADMARGGGAGGFAVSARLNGETALGTGVRAAQPNRRVVQANGADAPATSLSEWLSVSWLTPAMDRLFADSAGARRRFLDRLVLALEPGHAALAARYENALRERNRLMAGDTEPDPLWLDGIDAQLVEAGTALSEARERTVERIAAALAATPEGPFARPALTYTGQTADLAAALRDGRRRDRAAGRTLVGPHRDDLAVTLAAKAMPAAECSTGEQKAMLIAIVLAHAGLLDAARPRVLLLDEVAAHLDPVRRVALFGRLREAPGQYWLTGTDTAPFAEILREAAVWEVSDGNASRLR